MQKISTFLGRFNRDSLIFATIILAATAMLLCLLWLSDGFREAIFPNKDPQKEPQNQAVDTPTETELKVAFIGDSGYGDDFESVLRLIKEEKADMVLHQGDFDLNYDAKGFETKINAILGKDFPYFGSVGNHDADSWPTGCKDPDGCYAQIFKDRIAALEITLDNPSLNDEKYSITYKGLKMVFVGQNGSNSEFTSFIDRQLSNDNHIWKICSWHKNQYEMQLGSKPSEMGWDVYETCREKGAIIVTGHEHSYHRTKTLSSITNQTADPTCSERNFLCVDPGRTFVAVSGLGGKDIRNQDRCLPKAYPYGCKKEWAKVYTSDQGADYGALFITFYTDGDPKKARGYFKNVSGEIVDGPFQIRVGHPSP
jgi:predicted phosphodiesterase